MAALVAIAALPSAAAAKPGYFVFPGVFSLEADLGKDGGYSLSATAFGHHRLRVVAQRFGASASYSARGRVNGQRLNANFGKFGALHGRFHGTTREEPFFLPGCHGPMTIVGRGTLNGSFRFRGEGGYVQVATHRVRVHFERFFRQVCPNGGSSGEEDRALEHNEDLGANALEATAHGRGRSLSLRGIELEWGVALLTVATARERVGPVTIERTAESRGKDDSLAFAPWDSYPRAVSISPSAPFRGSAVYTEQEDGTSSWTGDLRVPLVGLGTVPLTGPEFRVRTCHGPLLRVIDGCH